MHILRPCSKHLSAFLKPIAVKQRNYFINKYEYFDKIFSTCLCGFRKGNSTQHCLLFMLEKLKIALDIGQCTGILLIDLTKTLYISCPFDYQNKCLSSSLMSELFMIKKNKYKPSKVSEVWNQQHLSSGAEGLGYSP